jgi:hypothetical protein
VTDFPALFSLLKEIDWSGPISVHFEYPLGGAEHGAGDLNCEPGVVKMAMKRDLRTLRKWLDVSGLI